MFVTEFVQKEYLDQADIVFQYLGRLIVFGAKSVSMSAQ